MIADKQQAGIARTLPENIMKKIRLEKITLNIGAGTEAENVEKAMGLLSRITESKPVKTFASKRIPTWKVRLGLPVGATAIVRGKKAEGMLKLLLRAVEFRLKKTSFTKNGFSFGIKEYIEIPGVKYDPKIGIIGLEVAVSLGRAGFHVKRRKIRRAKIHQRHEISAEEAWAWAEQNIGVKEKEIE